MRAPLLATAMLSLVCGVWLGLVRLGWILPLPWPDQLVSHGPIMVCGFLGTLIGLERAVALGKPWGYAAPAATAAGALLLDFGFLHVAGPLLITVGSAFLVGMCAWFVRREPSLFSLTMAAGSVAWAVGNAKWLAGAAIFRVVFWWVAFLVLTIAGERLELSRVLRKPHAVQFVFAADASLVLAGATVSAGWPASGVRVLGCGLIALAWWLVRHDVARRTLRLPGLSRFMAVCLLIGYGWLGLGGAIAVLTGATEPGTHYDALLHAIFLGFVMSMVFAHAAVMVPALVGGTLEYQPLWYVHVAVLHLSLLLRVAGDLVDDLGRWRGWGGLMNAIALSLFIINTARAVRVARTQSVA